MLQAEANSLEVNSLEIFVGVNVGALQRSLTILDASRDDSLSTYSYF